MSTLHLKQLQLSTGYSLIYELHQSLIFFFDMVKLKKKDQTKVRQHVVVKLAFL